MTPLPDYWEILRSHDWNFHRTRDEAEFEKAAKKEMKLRRISRESPDHFHLFKAMERFGFGDGPLPEKPVLEPW